MELVTVFTLALIGAGGALMANNHQTTKKIKEIETKLKCPVDVNRKNEEEIERIVARINNE